QSSPPWHEDTRNGLDLVSSCHGGEAFPLDPEASPRSSVYAGGEPQPPKSLRKQSWVLPVLQRFPLAIACPLRCVSNP
ncbi:MAG: hypothetical protein AB7U18_09490, partial [Dehalococcoidia bacterium]